MRTIEQKFSEAEIIIKEVKAMRILQKAYFKAIWEKDDVRKKNLLDQSKSQEKKVDAMIESYTDRSQNTLF